MQSIIFSNMSKTGDNLTICFRKFKMCIITTSVASRCFPVHILPWAFEALSLTDSNNIIYLLMYLTFFCLSHYITKVGISSFLSLLTQKSKCFQWLHLYYEKTFYYRLLFLLIQIQFTRTVIFAAKHFVFNAVPTSYGHIWNFSFYSCLSIIDNRRSSSKFLTEDIITFALQYYTIS